MKSGTILIAISFLVSKGLGLLRDNLLASGFGATNANGLFNLDTYYAAFRIPDLLYNLLSYGVLSAAFVPLFVEILKKKGKKSAFNFSNQILNTFSVFIILISGLLFVFAPLLLKIFVPGFEESEFGLTVNLTRIMLVTPLFFTIGSVASGIQNSLHKFLGISLAPIFYNAGIIFGILVLSPKFGVYGAAIGVSAGALLSILIQLPAIVKSGFRYFLPKKLLTPAVKEMIFLSLPRIFGMSVTQISLLVDTVIASTLSTGTITIINFASNLESLPVGLIGLSFAIVSFGTLSGFAAEGKKDEFAAEISNNLRKMFFLLIPLALGMFALRSQIVQVVLGGGKFNITDIALTADTMGIFLSGLVFGSTVFLLARAFYALKDTRTPVLIGVASVLTNIFISFISTRLLNLGSFGLAAANSIADIINASFLLALLSRKLNRSILDFAETGKFLLSAAAMIIFIFAIKISMDRFWESSRILLAIQLLAVSSAGAAIYFAICYMLKCKEMILAVSLTLRSKKNPRIKTL